MSLISSLFGGGGQPENSSLPWIYINDFSMVEEARSASFYAPVVLYKHSTRCGISSMMLNRLERSADLAVDELQWYFLDLIKFRDISQRVATALDVRHESPQILVLKDGEVIHHASHGQISMEDILNVLN